MSRLKSVLVNVIVALAATSAAFAMTELGVRLIAPQATGLKLEDRYGLTMHYPGITRHLPRFGHVVSFNAAGLRGREHHQEKQPGITRILVLGDSFMEAIQVPLDSSFSILLERGLQRRGRPVEVINGGVSGWGTDDELRYLTSYGLRYRPDVVLVAMTLHNDIMDNLREEWHTIKDGALVEKQKAPAPFLRYKIVQLKAFLATRLQTYQLWRRARHGQRIKRGDRELKSHVIDLFTEPTPPRVERGYLLTELLLARMSTVAAASGARLVVMLLPLEMQMSDAAFASFIRSAGTPPEGNDPLKPQRLMTQAAEKLGITVIDLLPTFRRWGAERTDPLFLEGDGHWNAAGHRLAATEAVGMLAGGDLAHFPD